MFVQIFTIQKETHEAPEIYAYELNWMAFLYQVVGQYDKAFSLCRHALQITNVSMKKNSFRYVKIQNNVALIYERLEKYESAHELFLQERSVIKKIYGNENPEYAACLDNLGTLYIRKPQFALSQKYFLEAL